LIYSIFKQFTIDFTWAQEISRRYVPKALKVLKGALGSSGEGYIEIEFKFYVTLVYINPVKRQHRFNSKNKNYVAFVPLDLALMAKGLLKVKLLLI